VEFLSRVHLSCFLLSYLVAFGGELFRLLRGKQSYIRLVLIIAGAAGLLAHTAYLVNRSLASGLPPLVGSSHDWLLVLAWLGGLLYVLAVTTHEKLAIGIFLLPVTIGLVVMALFVDAATTDGARHAAHRWGMLHAATLVVGMGCVAAATICALMYLVQYQKLRGGNRWLHRLQLPNLERLTLLNRWLVVGTVAMLTVGLLTGFILAAIQKDGVPNTFRWSDPIVAGTVVVWGIMVATLVWLLTRKEQTGRQVARLTLVAGGFLLLTVFGLMLLSGGVHGNGSNKASEKAQAKDIQTKGGHLIGGLS